MIEYLILAQLKLQSPQLKPIQSVPIVSAKSALVYDMPSQNIVYQKNIHDKVPIASLTKLMTAYIIMQEHQLSEVVKISKVASQTAGSSMNLAHYDQLTIKQLLEGLLINSGNDAAVALAIHNSKNVPQFVQKMNLYAKMLELNSTSFQNPMGFDHPLNYSTAADLLKLSQLCFANDTIKEISQTKTLTIRSKLGKIYKLLNTNSELQNYLKVTGLKTGKTPQAQECFIGTNQNQQISIVLNSKNRFLDTKNLLDWSK